MSVIYIIHVIASVISVLWLLGVVIHQRREIKLCKEHCIPVARQEGNSAGRRNMSEWIAQKEVDRIIRRKQEIREENEHLDFLIDVEAIVYDTFLGWKAGNKRENEELSNKASQAWSEHQSRLREYEEEA